MDSLKDRLLDRLAVIGKTQLWLAGKLEVSPQTLNAWLKKNQIPVVHLFKVCKELKCTADWLVGEKQHELHLTETETLLLNKFRSLTKDQQDREIAYLKDLISEYDK